MLPQCLLVWKQKTAAKKQHEFAPVLFLLWVTLLGVGKSWPFQGWKRDLHLGPIKRSLGKTSLTWIAQPKFPMDIQPLDFQSHYTFPCPNTHPVAAFFVESKWLHFFVQTWPKKAILSEKSHVWVGNNSKRISTFWTISSFGRIFHLSGSSGFFWPDVSVSAERRGPVPGSPVFGCRVGGVMEKTPLVPPEKTTESTANELREGQVVFFGGNNSKPTRWFKPWPFHPLVGGHLTISKGHLTIPKRSQRIARYLEVQDT